MPDERQPIGQPPQPPRVVGGGRMAVGIPSGFEEDPWRLPLWASRMPTSTHIEDRRGQPPDYSQPINPNGGWRMNDFVPPGGGDPRGQSLAVQPPTFPGVAPSVDIPPPANMPTWLQILANGLGHGGPLAAGPPAPTNLPMQRPSYAGPAISPTNPPISYGGPEAAADAAGHPRSSITPSASPVASRSPAAPPILPSMVDLGYYRPGVGNARTPTFVPQGQTTAPSIYRGPMTTGPGNRTPYYG